MKGTKINICVDCGADISDRGNRSFRCEPCQDKATKKLKRQNRRKQWTHKGKKRFCEDCGKPLFGVHYHKRFCENCLRTHKSELQRNEYRENKEKFSKTCHEYYIEHREEILRHQHKHHRVWTEDEVKLCARCFIDINHLNAGAIYCKECAEIVKEERINKYQQRHRQKHNNTNRKTYWRKWEVKLPGNILVNVYSGRKYGGKYGFELANKYPSKLISNTPP